MDRRGKQSLKNIIQGKQYKNTTKFLPPNKQKYIIEKRKQGQTWCDVNGWHIIKDGKMQPYTPPTKQQLGLMPTFCPICKRMMRHKLDMKYWIYQNMCYQCGVKKQTQMRINGTWNDYIQVKKIHSQISKTMQQKTVLEQMIKNLTQKSNIKIVKNSEGSLQNWQIPQSVKNKSLQNINNLLNTIQQYLNALQNRLKQIQDNKKEK